MAFYMIVPFNSNNFKLCFKYYINSVHIMRFEFWYFKERQWYDYLETYCAEDVNVLGIYWHFLITLLVWVPLGLMGITVSTY